MKLKKKDNNHDKYMSTQEFNELIADNFTARLAQVNLATNNDIVNFVKKTDFDDKLKSSNKNFTSNKTKHVLVEKVEVVSTKGTKKDLINKYKILNGIKYFSLGILQNYLVFISSKKYFKHFSGTTEIYSCKSNGM